jgi:ribosomal protein L31E
VIVAVSATKKKGSSLFKTQAASDKRLVTCAVYNKGKEQQPTRLRVMAKQGSSVEGRVLAKVNKD